MAALLAAAVGGGGIPAVFTTYPSVEQPYPYILVDLVTENQRDAMNARVHEVSFNVHVFVEERFAAANPVQRGGEINGRVLGDWPQQSSRLPTYGLDRYVPPLSGSSWTPDIIAYQGTTPAHEFGILHWIHAFNILCTEIGV